MRDISCAVCMHSKRVSCVLMYNILLCRGWAGHRPTVVGQETTRRATVSNIRDLSSLNIDADLVV